MKNFKHSESLTFHSSSDEDHPKISLTKPSVMFSASEKFMMGENEFFISREEPFYKPTKRDLYNRLKEYQIGPSSCNFLLENDFYFSRMNKSYMLKLNPRSIKSLSLSDCLTENLSFFKRLEKKDLRKFKYLEEFSAGLRNMDCTSYFKSFLALEKLKIDTHEVSRFLDPNYKLLFKNTTLLRSLREIILDFRIFPIEIKLFSQLLKRNPLARAIKLSSDLVCINNSDFEHFLKVITNLNFLNSIMIEIKSVDYDYIEADYISEMEIYTAMNEKLSNTQVQTLEIKLPRTYRENDVLKSITFKSINYEDGKAGTSSLGDLELELDFNTIPNYVEQVGDMILTPRAIEKLSFIFPRSSSPSKRSEGSENLNESHSIPAILNPLLNLKSLKLLTSFDEFAITSIAEALKKLLMLENLELRHVQIFRAVKLSEGAGILAKSLSQMRTLKSIEIDFSGLNVTEEGAMDIAISPKNLYALKRVNLTLSAHDNDKMYYFGLILKNYGEKKRNLEEFSLKSHNQINRILIDDVGKLEQPLLTILADFLTNTPALKYFSYVYANKIEINEKELANFSSKLASMKNLEQVSLDLWNISIPKVEMLNHFVEALTELQKLKILDLKFFSFEYKKIDDFLISLAKNLDKMKRLERLTLELDPKILAGNGIIEFIQIFQNEKRILKCELNIMTLNYANHQIWNQAKNLVEKSKNLILNV